MCTPSLVKLGAQGAKIWHEQKGIVHLNGGGWFHTSCWARRYGAGLVDFSAHEPRWLVDFFCWGPPLLLYAIVNLHRAKVIFYFGCGPERGMLYMVKVSLSARYHNMLIQFGITPTCIIIYCGVYFSGYISCPKFLFGWKSKKLCLWDILLYGFGFSLTFRLAKSMPNPPGEIPQFYPAAMSPCYIVQGNT